MSNQEASGLRGSEARNVERSRGMPVRPGLGYHHQLEETISLGQRQDVGNLHRSAEDFGRDESYQRERSRTPDRSRRDDKPMSVSNGSRNRAYINQETLNTQFVNRQNVNMNLQDQGDSERSEVQRDRRREMEAPPNVNAEPTLKLLHDLLSRALQPQEIRARHSPPDFLKLVTTMKNLGTYKYKGSVDPFEADEWLQMIEGNFAAKRCPEEHRKTVAVYSLEADAAAGGRTLRGNTGMRYRGKSSERNLSASIFLQKPDIVWNGNF